MLSENLGYACINMNLSSKKPTVTTNRSMIKKTFSNKGIKYAGELAIKNCHDLKKILIWNLENNINFFRISSNLFPWASEYEISELSNYHEIKTVLKNCGDFATKNKMRLTFHPGPFNVLTSPHEKVVKNCIKDLTIHAQVFDLMGFPETTYNKINIHIGGAYNDKKKSMDRFNENFNKLPKSVRKRLTVENDDRASLYSVKDLYENVYKIINIPIVFDYHHHKFNSSGMSEKEALLMAISTWSNIKPVVHYSESRSIEKNDNSIRPQAHSDYIYNRINTYGQDIDIMIEAKKKELALIKYIQINKKLANNKKTT